MEAGNNIYGIFPMIVGSVYVTAGAIILGVPLGILCAVFLVWFCPKRLYKIIKPAVELLAGIPSIVYGFFGLMVLVPIMQSLFGGGGKGILTASILLGIMILPTIIGVSESNIRAVPMSYYEGSLGLGATHERSVFFAVLPAAKQGILAGVVLGIGRARRGNHGGCHDCRESAYSARQHFQRCPHHDGEYRYGNGLCNGFAQRSPAWYGSGAVRIHPDYQSELLALEKEG